MKNAGFNIGRHGWHLLVSTFWATSATASFMATDFHDLSPYVLVGNPLTLAIIELFAVPGALIGSLLYPLGLDAPVWTYVGMGIRIVLWAARLIGSAPGSTVHLHAFASWALPFLALGVVNAVIWRTWIMRAFSVPLLAIGLMGAISGAPFDIVVPPTGDALAIRGADGQLKMIGRRPSAFAVQQWLAADADGRSAAEAKSTTEICDRLGCVDTQPNGDAISVVTSAAAFEEDCSRAKIIVSPLEAPENCKASLVFDRRKLAQTGAITLRYDQPERMVSERQTLTNRPWSLRPADKDNSAPARKPAFHEGLSEPATPATDDSRINDLVDGTGDTAP